jgi:hypothetical protein
MERKIIGETEVGAPVSPEQVKKSGWTPSLFFIVADEVPTNKRRSEVLAAVYKFLLVGVSHEQNNSSGS